MDRTYITLLNGFSFLVIFFIILGGAADYAGLTASFRAHVNIVSLLTYLLTYLLTRANGQWTLGTAIRVGRCSDLGAEGTEWPETRMRQGMGVSFPIGVEVIFF